MAEPHQNHHHQQHQQQQEQTPPSRSKAVIFSFQEDVITAPIAVETQSSSDHLPSPASFYSSCQKREDDDGHGVDEYEGDCEGEIRFIYRSDDDKDDKDDDDDDATPRAAIRTSGLPSSEKYPWNPYTVASELFADYDEKDDDDGSLFSDQGVDSEDDNDNDSTDILDVEQSNRHSIFRMPAQQRKKSRSNNKSSKRNNPSSNNTEGGKSDQAIGSQSSQYHMSSKKSNYTTKENNKTWVYGMGIVSVFVAIFMMVLAIRESQRQKQHDESQQQANINIIPPLSDKTKSATFFWQEPSFDGTARVSSEYNVLEVVNHDPTSFTQGLFWHDGNLVESTGMYGESLVRVWSPYEINQEDDEDQYGYPIIQQQVPLEEKYFGEGMCWFQDENGDDYFIQLTWQERTAFVYHAGNLTLAEQFEYETSNGQGWGITFDPLEKVFYVVDGSEYVSVWNLEFEEIRRFVVSMKLKRRRQRNLNGVETGGDEEFDIDEYPAIHWLNELEWDPHSGTILANVLTRNYVLRIHPKTGQVLQVYSLEGLYTNRSPKADVMNGIALGKRPNQFWLTGKYWPHLYLVEFVDS